MSRVKVLKKLGSDLLEIRKQNGILALRDHVLKTPFPYLQSLIQHLHDGFFPDHFKRIVDQHRLEVEAAFLSTRITLEQRNEVLVSIAIALAISDEDPKNHYFLETEIDELLNPSWRKVS